MLTHLQDLGIRVGEFAIQELSGHETASALKVLASHYGPATDPARLVPRCNETAIRDAIEQSAPRLAESARDLRRMLETDYSAVIVRRMQLQHLTLEHRAFILFALSLCMGTPTPTDRVHQRIVWDVKADPALMQAGDASTFSEHAYEAKLHTDTQYFAHPERYVLLYFSRAADCGGGVSLLRSASCIRQQLARTESGRRALDLLSRRVLPFRIPGTFTDTGQRDEIEVTFAPVFAATPALRFRIDTLERGLAVHPEHATPEVREALAVLSAELERPQFMYQELLAADSALIVNNHEVLHGRTEFNDLQRHAFRIRIADTLTAHNSGQHGSTLGTTPGRPDALPDSPAHRLQSQDE